MDMKIPRGFIARMNAIGAPKVERWSRGRLPLPEAVRQFFGGKLVLLVKNGRAELLRAPKDGTDRTDGTYDRG